MVRALWVSKSGLDAQQVQLDVIANNLANVSTTGFKRARPVFEDLLYQTVRQAGAQSSQTTIIPGGLQLGTGVRPVATERILTQGNLTQTGNALDVAIQGDGFLQVSLPDGTLGYSRAGNLQVDNTGQIVTPNGFPISPAITIPANTLNVTIGSDGVVSVTRAGQAAATQIGTIQLANFINPGGLQSFGNNLYLETTASGSPTVGTPGINGLGLLNQGYLETSNVNVVEELVLMIQTQRAFEINSRAIQSADAMLGRLSQL